MTVGCMVSARVQRVQKVEETLNKFKQTRLVSKNVGRCKEWEGRRVGGQVDCDRALCCICEGPEGSET